MDVLVEPEPEPLEVEVEVEVEVLLLPLLPLVLVLVEPDPVETEPEPDAAGVDTDADPPDGEALTPPETELPRPVADGIAVGDGSVIRGRVCFECRGARLGVAL